MNTIYKAICAALGFAAVVPSAALAEDKKAEASIERQAEELRAGGGKESGLLSHIRIR